MAFPSFSDPKGSYIPVIIVLGVIIFLIIISCMYGRWCDGDIESGENKPPAAAAAAAS
ncbi:hypothetical protein CASFOL_026988 [Castilleja foliolosa]|uniref:Uncharacterized protein n=1 Tax=Castilleja foliolosa TaxID=1961234 RepID=A0ABD3CIN7_9LAMI